MPRRLRRLLRERLAYHWNLETHTVSLGLRSLLVPLAFAGTLLWLVIDPQPFALTGVIFTGSLLLIGFAWARAMAIDVSTRRILRFSALQVGDHLEEALVLENRSDLPVLFSEFIDRSAIPGYTIDGVRVAGQRASQTWRMQAICTLRGVYSLGDWDVRLGDPFGVFEVHQAYRQNREIIVYPPLARLPVSTGDHRRALGERLALRQALPAETVNAMTTRPYAAGDAVRRIHWRTTARHDDLFVKVFEPEASSVMWLLLDLDESVHAGEGNESSLEKMIMVAATLAWQLLGQQVAVGLILDTEQSQVVPPHASRARLWPILRALATVRPARTPLKTALAQAASLISTRDSVAVLTPSLNADWVGVLPMITAGAQGGLEVWLLDPASFGGHGSSVGLADLLRGLGTPTRVLRREDIQPVMGTLDKVRRWEFRTLATGRAVPYETPRPPALPGP